MAQEYDPGRADIQVTGAGGGGGAVTIAAGDDTTQGNTTDAAVTTNAAGTVSGKLRGLVAILADVWNSTLQALRVQAGGYTEAVWANVTRPNDTSVYAAGDTVTDNTATGSATNLTFTNVARANGGTGIITRSAVVSTNNSSAPATFVLNLFTTAPATSGDNVAGAFSDAELQGGLYVGEMVFNLSRPVNPAAAGSGNRVYRCLDPLPFKCAAGTRNLIGVLQVDGAYTPIAQERFDVGLYLEQN